MARKSGKQRRSDRDKRKLTSSKNKLQKITDRLEFLNLNRENLLSRNPRHSSRYRKEFKDLLNEKKFLTSKISSKEALLINQQAGFQNLENIDAEQDRLWGDYRDREIAIENKNKDELAISTLNALKKNKVVNTAENLIGPEEKSVQDSGRGGSVKVDGKPLMDQLRSEQSDNIQPSTVHTRHYKTGERLGVMTRSQRRAYEKEAGDKTFEQRVSEYEKSSGHGKSHLRETLYKRNLRKNKKKLSIVD